MNDKLILMLLKDNLKFYEMFGRLEKAYEIFESDEQLIGELENVLEMYRELKKESENQVW